MKPIHDNELKEIIEGCVKKNSVCQKRVYDAYYQKMMSVSLRYSNGYDNAMDILQDAFIKVFTNISKFQGNGSFEGWIRRIVVNTAIDFHRKTKSEATYADSDYVERFDEADEEVDVEKDIYLLDVNDILKEVQNLSPAYKTVFNLYAFEGYSHKQIADELGINEGTSKSNYAKAKRNLKKALEPLLKAKNLKDEKSF